MNGKQFADALLTELDKKKNRRVKVPVTWETLGELVREALNPMPVEEGLIPIYAPPEIPPDFPKLKVRYGVDELKKFAGLSAEKIVELQKRPPDLSASAWIVVETAKQEEPFHGSGWLTRPLSELTKLQADGVPEYQLPRKNGVA